MERLCAASLGFHLLTPSYCRPVFHYPNFNFALTVRQDFGIDVIIGGEFEGSHRCREFVKRLDPAKDTLSSLRNLLTGLSGLTSDLSKSRIFPTMVSGSASLQFQRPDLIGDSCYS